MNSTAKQDLEGRVIQAAEDALNRQGYVCALDVLSGIQWIAPQQIEAWRKGIIPTIEENIQCNPDKLRRALTIFRTWAAARGLTPAETRYARTSRDSHVDLRFTLDGDSARETQYRTH